MRFMAVLLKGLIGGVFLFISSVLLGMLPILLEARFCLQLAVIVMSIPVLVAWMYQFK